MGTRQAQDNSKPTKKKGSRPRGRAGSRQRVSSRFLTAPMAEYCLKRAYGDSIRTAAAVIGIPVGTALTWNGREDIRKQIEEYSKQIAELGFQKETKARLLTTEFLDDQVVSRLRRTKKTTNQTNELVQIGYDSLGLIPKGRVQVSASAAAQSAAQSLTGANAFDVYEPLWLTRKKAEWDKQLEQKYSNGLPELPEFSQG